MRDDYCIDKRNIFVPFTFLYSLFSYLSLNGGLQWEIWSIEAFYDGDWHHVADMRQGDTGTVYIDREPDGAATNAVMDLDDAIKVAIGADIHNNTRYFKVIVTK